MNRVPVDRRSLIAGLVTAGVLPAWLSPLRANAFLPRLAAWQQAKFGLFIHWGPYSQASVEASWPLIDQKRWKISEQQYVALARTFNPVKFNPDAFIDAAVSAGQRYMVFTTKHHDGFCMFDSAYTDYKITRSPYGKDITAMLAAACARRGMPLGFYYSPPDMHHPGFRDTSKPVKLNWDGEPERPQWPSYLDYMERQLTELLTRYGRVMTVWFDGLYRQEKYKGQRFVDLIRRLQPATLVNDRIGVPGDYATPEQFIPAGIPTRDIRFDAVDKSVQQRLRGSVPDPKDFQPWETCMTINDTWAFNVHDRNFKSSAQIIRSLVEVVSRGGNFLLNVGPRPDGTIQPEFLERLAAVGRWMRANGEAVYGTTYGPIQGQEGVRTTAKDAAVYVHLMRPLREPLVLSGLRRRVIAARLLASRRRLPFANQGGSWQIEVGRADQQPVTVIKLALA
jgi:alpha-L-fucosidase